MISSSYCIFSHLPLLALNRAIKVLIRVHNINVIIYCRLIARDSNTCISGRTSLVVGGPRSLINYGWDLSHHGVLALHTYLRWHYHAVIQASLCAASFGRRLREGTYNHSRGGSGGGICLWFLTQNGVVDSDPAQELCKLPASLKVVSKEPVLPELL